MVGTIISALIFAYGIIRLIWKVTEASRAHERARAIEEKALIIKQGIFYLVYYIGFIIIAIGIKIICPW